MQLYKFVGDDVETKAFGRKFKSQIIMSTKQVTLHIPERHYNFFMELVESLSFVKKIETDNIEKPPSKKEVLNGIKEGLQQSKLHQAGKLKLQTAQQLLDEL
jgi:hypothetical protein